MAKLKFDVLDIENDTTEINSWCNKFRWHENYEGVRRFALHGSYYDLAHLLAETYDPKSEDPTKQQVQLAVRENNEIVAFVVFKMHDLHTTPYTYLHYIVVRPDKQGNKIGEQIIKSLPLEIKKLFGKEPSEMYGYVEKENKASQAFFAKLGADFLDAYDDNFDRVVLSVPMKQKTYE